MRYLQEQGEELGDHDDQIEWARWSGYQTGVEKVLNYVKSVNAYPKLTSELEWAIREMII